ncbi:MAG TPA: hypothetical protein VF069_05295 [Streptosporangiaceae bacterium]
MPKVRLSYWWRDHEPGDVVEVDEQTALLLIGQIAAPAGTDESSAGGD